MEITGKGKLVNHLKDSNQNHPNVRLHLNGFSLRVAVKALQKYFLNDVTSNSYLVTEQLLSLIKHQ